MNYACLRVGKWLSSQDMVVTGTKNNILDYLLCVKYTLSSGYFTCDRTMSTTRGSTITAMPPYTRHLPSASEHSSTGCADTVLGSYLHVAAPLGLPFQQGIQDSPAGLLGSRVIPTHHVVG